LSKEHFPDADLFQCLDESIVWMLLEGIHVEAHRPWNDTRLLWYSSNGSPDDLTGNAGDGNAIKDDVALFYLGKSKKSEDKRGLPTGLLRLF
jgi:hypothetical protein